jgi:hypothetical protein
MTKTTIQQFSFITLLFSDTCRHTKNKIWRRCRLYFRGRMQCWWIFNFETIIQGLPELADQNNTVKSLSSGNNRKNILKNVSSLDFKIRTFLIDQSRVDTVWNKMIYI